MPGAAIRVETVRPDDPTWEEWLERVPRDVFHTAGYHAYSEGSGEGQAYLAVVGNHDRGVAWPYLLRQVNPDDHGAQPITDVNSVYGYPGPLAWGCAPGDAFLDRAWTEIQGIWRAQGVITAFTRFHPILANAAMAQGFRSPGDDSIDAVVDNGRTVSIDLSLGYQGVRAAYGRDLRREIDRSKAAGLVTEVDTEFAELATFARLYKETMQRLHAADYYFFQESDFRRLRDALPGRMDLILTRLHGEVAAAGLFTEWHGLVEWYLVGTDSTFANLSPSKALVDFAIEWAIGRGASVLHLGGGRGGSDDSLLWFKGRFSPRRHVFYTGRWILNPALTAELSAARRAALEPGTSLEPNYFPEYRAPIVDTDGREVRSVSIPTRPAADAAAVGPQRADRPAPKAVNRNVLVTAAGRRTSLVRSFATEVHKRGGRILAGDVDPLAPALFVADEAIKMRAATDPGYIDSLLGTVKAAGIGLLVPTIDPELPVLARSRAALMEAGCLAAVSNESFVEITSDKLLTVTVFGEQGVAVPRSWVMADRPADLPNVVFVKPRRGSASQGAGVASRDELPLALAHIDDPLIQEVLSGPEITIDALLDLDGRPVHYVPRYRLRTLAGESIQGVTVEHDQELEAWIQRLLELCGSLGAAGPLCLQAFLTDRGPVLSEINARFGGGFPLGLAAGGAYTSWLLDFMDGVPVPSRLGQYDAGLYMTRYHNEFITRTPKW
jgi:carbamoyl-phosphate synthase large subunit